MNERIKRLSLPLVTLVALLIWGVGAAWAGEPHDRSIPRGGRHDGDIEVIRDDFDIEEDATVRGDITIIGGDAKIAGTIDGSLFVLGGDVELLESAEITGECVLFGGDMDNISKTECATFADGDFRVSDMIGNGFSGAVPPAPNMPGDGATFGGTLFSTLLFGVMGFFIASVAPRRVERIGNAAAVKPVVTGTVGILTLFATLAILTIVAILTGLLLIVLIGILGIPVIIAILGMLAISMLVGWIAVGKIVGATLTDALRLHKVSPAITIALGTAALTFGVGLLKLMPLVGFSGDIAAFLIAGVGLGGVALTRFGATHYPRLIPQKLEDQIILPDEDQIIL